MSRRGALHVAPVLVLLALAALFPGTAQALMRALQTLRVDEELRPAEPPIRGVYTYQAPDRMHSSLSTGSELVWVGGTRYFRPRPDQPWRVEATRLSIRAPSFIWDSEGQHIRQVVAPRLLGTASLGGADVQVIAFFVVRGRSPIWFRLWVDATGLVRQSEMRAQSHYMDHRYYDFDAPLTIEPPATNLGSRPPNQGSPQHAQGQWNGTTLAAT